MISDLSLLLGLLRRYYPVYHGLVIFLGWIDRWCCQGSPRWLWGFYTDFYVLSSTFFGQPSPYPSQPSVPRKCFGRGPHMTGEGVEGVRPNEHLLVLFTTQPPVTHLSCFKLTAARSRSWVFVGRAFHSSRSAAIGSWAELAVGLGRWGLCEPLNGKVWRWWLDYHNRIIGTLLA